MICRLDADNESLSRRLDMQNAEGKTKGKWKDEIKEKGRRSNVSLGKCFETKRLMLATGVRALV
jgi:hypothetical protein